VRTAPISSVRGKLRHRAFDFGIGDGEAAETGSDGLEYPISPTDLHTWPTRVASLEPILLDEPALKRDWSEEPVSISNRPVTPSAAARMTGILLSVL
jgi:hypothetical protein